MVGLQSNLTDLHSCLHADSPAQHAEKAHNIAGDVGHVCLQDVTEKDIEYTCSLLFSKDTGAVSFLRNAVKHDEYQNVKVELVEMLRTFTAKWPTKVVPYAMDIKDVCVALFRRDKYSKVKSNALMLLIEILKHVPGTKVAMDLDMKKLVNQFFLELTQPTKHTSTVKQLLYHLLGVLAEGYPEEMVSYAERLGDMYVRVIKAEMTSKTKKPDLPIISGCLQGLNHYLVNFTQSADEGYAVYKAYLARPGIFITGIILHVQQALKVNRHLLLSYMGAKHSFAIYKATKMAINKDIQHTRYDVPRAGLLLLARHAPQFSFYIIDDYEVLYDTLKYWSKHNNREMLHLGTKALQAVLTQVAEMLVSQAKEGKKEGRTFKFFIKRFRDIMDNPDANNKEVSLAIRGYGLFAAPCKIFLSTKDVQFMFNEMMQRSDQIFFDQAGVTDDRLLSLPSYLDALASIIHQLDEVSETFVWSLERLVVVLMENVPNINIKMHHACQLSLLRIFHSLMPKGAILRVFLARVVYQSVIRTCSHPVVLVTEESALELVRASDVGADDKPAISYRDYIKLWTSLLSSSRFKELMAEGVSVEERVALTEALYTELMAAILRVLGKLDLGSQRDGQQDTDEGSGTSDDKRADSPETVTSDPVTGLQAVKPKDFIVFINLVDFTRDLLPNQLTHLFKCWVFKFGHELIIYSTKHPLVSGFYKLLAVCMTICTKINYFNDLEPILNPASNVRVKEEDSEEPMDVDHGEDVGMSECESCFLLFTKFTKEVLTRLKQYKDDLLASCLTFILSLPHQIVCAEISSIVPALQMSLQLGVSYLTLALVGLEALERWKQTLPPHVINPYWCRVLPCLDPYLKTTRDIDAENGETLALTSKGTSRKAGKKKLPVKLLAQTRADSFKSHKSQLVQVQQRCLTLLGTLGGSTNHNLVRTSGTNGREQLAEHAVAWDSVTHLKFDMPFMDIKPVIFLDPFLPRIAELATSSSDRQTKVAACELLHTLVLYAIGRGVQKRAGDAHRHSMEKLYRKLFPVIMTLACDVEQVAKQLFEPLMLQMIHWFTGNKKYESEDTMALLDTLIDGIVDPTDTARRDFSAKCLKEFLVWSIKQTSKKEMERSPGNIKSLLKRLYSLSHHPSAFKRLGSAIAFNSIYTVFREEDSLVDQFTFQILVNYIDSLAMAHSDDKSLGTQEQCWQVLTHIERIIKSKAKLLSKVNNLRIIPREWKDATLLTAVRWLIRQCGRPHSKCRHAAMQLIFNLTPCIDPKIKSARDFFMHMQKECEPDYFITRFERGVYKHQSRSGLAQCHTMEQLAETFTLKTAVHWYDMLLATLDCYTWVFGQNLLSPAKSFVVSGNKGTVLFKVITHFLNDLALADISAAADLFKVRRDVLLFTPHEKDEYNRVKCTAIVRLMDFVVVLLGPHQKDSLKVVPGSFWSENLWELIVRCVLQPTKVGFNMADVEVMMKLPEQMTQVLQVLTRLPPDVSKGFKACLVQKLSKEKECDLNSMLPLSRTGSGENQFAMLHLIKGISQLKTLRLLQPAILHVGDQEQFAGNILQSVFEGVVDKGDDHKSVAQLTPQSVDLAVALLQLAFNIGVKPKTILDLLLDKTPLCQPGSGTAQQGSVFYAQFTFVLNQHLLLMSASFIPALCYHAEVEWAVVASVLTGMLEKASKDRTLRKTEGKGLVRLILKQWCHLAVWWESEAATEATKVQALLVLTKMLMVDSKMVIDTESDNFGTIFNMYLDYLTDRKTSLAFKSWVLDLLVFFVNLPEPQLKKLKDRLDWFVADNFPMQSSEFAVGSPKHSDYITALNKILSALDISGSLVLLELVLSIMCRETPHVHEEEIQNTLLRFIRRLPMDKHKLALDVPYTIFRREGSYSDEIRRAALERACLPMLRIVHKGALTEFFSSHIKEIMATLESKFNKGSEDVFSTQLISKTCCFELLEVMYSRLPKDDVFTKTAQINATFCDQRVETGKELTTTITKMSNQAKSEDCRGEDACRNLRRTYHCAAYNMLIATISCTQTDIKFYNGFLFNENQAKGQFLLDNFVDVDKSYSFLVEMETLHERKKRFVSIRNEVRAGRHTEEDVYETTSVHYLASQYLADSSLSMDLSQFDFGSSAATASMSGSPGGDRRSRLKKKDSGFEEPTVTIEADYVEMEMDELNQHECMATMTALLQHMKRNNITPPVEKGATPTAMPVWMDNLHKKMRHHSTSTNVKLFLAKLLINTEEVFRPYARFWIQPLVQLVVTGETRCPGIHYFIVDIVVTILSWHTVAIPEDTVPDRGMASSLLEFLLKNCHNDNRRILRNNLDVIKTLVEVWKDRLDIPHKVIYDNFSQSEKGTGNATGIQMLGVVLANKLPPYSNSSGVNKDKFFQHLAMNMMNSLKTVYAASAEVVGMVLKYLAEREKTDADKKWQDGYKDNIAKMLSAQITKPDLFVTCVYRMQLHHPPVVDKFISKVLFLLPRLHGDFRTQCLEIIRSRADHVDNIFTEMKNKNLLSLLTHRDEGCQLVSLKLVQAMLTKLNAEELLTLLPPVAAFSKHPSAACRAVMYDILMWIYDNNREEDTDTAHSIMSATKDGLLTGLSEDDLKNRLTVQNFWSHETRLPTGTVDRMVAMLEAMYSPNSERQYLAYATNLLLEMTSKSPDYNRAIFEHPLSECRFEDYTITSSWRQRHVAMTPLFVATQMSQTQGSGDPAMETDDNVGGHVRATMDAAAFTPTQQPGSSKAPYNWLTQSSLDTYSDYNLTQTASDEPQSSLLFTVGKAPPRITKRAAPGAGFGKGRVGNGRDEPGVSEAEPGKGSDILRLKKRFLKDQGASAQLYFMKKNARLKQLRADVQNEQKARRENMVTMYRKYRTGDFPDIQIKHSYIIAPLQALAQRDSHIGRLLFGSLFKSIFPEIEVVKTDREARDTVEQITKSLNAMLNNSTQYYPAFIACVLDIALEFPRWLKLEPNAVNTACLTGQQQPLGIILLEEMLIYGGNEEEPRPAKRARGVGLAVTQMSRDTATWIELARLYKSLGDYDVLRGILSSRVGTQDLTMKAMEAEMRGDYKEAMSLYNNGLAQTDWDDSPPKDAEVDLWDTSRLECCAHLADWSQLEAFTTQAVDDANPPNLDLVWDDTYFQEHYLPFIIRGRLKLLMEGGDQQMLLKFVDDALCVPERKALLESSYCEELAMMYMWQEDYDRARHFSTVAEQAFLQEWSGLNTLMDSSRSVSLQRLQKLTELKEFLTFMGNDSNFQSVASATLLVHRWLRRSPDPILDSATTWDDIVTNRSVYLDHINCRLEMAGIKDDPDGVASNSWSKHKVEMWLGQASSACLQDNFPVASKLIKKTHKVLKTIRNDHLLLQWAETYATYNIRRAQVANLKTANERLSVAMTALDQLEKFKDSGLLVQNPILGSKHYRLKGMAVREMISVLQDIVALDDFEADLQTKVKVAAGNVSSSDIDQVVLGLVEQGFGHLKLAVSIADQSADTQQALHDVTGVNDAHMAFVRYCDHYLQQAEEDEDINVKCPSFEKFHVALLMSVLTAMRLGSTQARQRFPRLLQLVEKFPDTIDIFIRKAAHVPCWMFLGWMAQLTAVLDKPESRAVQQILLDIAKTYPDALIYPFKLSDDGYDFCNTPVGRKSKGVRDQLNAILSKNKLVNAFISSLEQFGQPNALFRDWYDDALRMLSQKPSERKAQKIMSDFRKMYADLMDQNSSEDQLYDLQTDTASSQIPARVGMGKYRCQFAKKHAAKVESICGKDGRKLLSINQKSFQRDVSVLIIEMGAVAKIPEILKEYSQWLDEFQGMNYDQDLELPGQYDGLAKPMPEYHVKINSFDKRVMVLTSLRKPKRISIRGNDEREYLYLVKGGEDLRQDQRVEQLFTIMNDVFMQDAACRQRKYSIRTYQVIPMTARLGMIEWMKKTTPLKDFLENAMTDQERAFYYSPKGPSKDFYKFLGGNDKDHYFRCYQNLSRSDVVTAFRRREEAVPWDLSRRAYRKLSCSSEAYFMLRCNFAISHALVSVCQYMLGIGDRHTSNFMIDLVTGCMVGIDFGHAFGSATTFLPIPELMPIRLTRQLRNLLLPLREKGLVEGTMLHALRALRNNSDLLLATMDVFVKEPSLDWQQNADKQRSMQGIKEDSDLDTNWYPKQKVMFAKKKLQGHHPTYITRDELALGHKKKKNVYPYIEKVLMGDREHDIRARLPQKDLTVEQQVACLLNQATDPNILGRVWGGWCSWL